MDRSPAGAVSAPYQVHNASYSLSNRYRTEIGYSPGIISTVFAPETEIPENRTGRIARPAERNTSPNPTVRKPCGHNVGLRTKVHHPTNHPLPLLHLKHQANRNPVQSIYTANRPNGRQSPGLTPLRIPDKPKSMHSLSATRFRHCVNLFSEQASLGGRSSTLAIRTSYPFSTQHLRTVPPHTIGIPTPPNPPLRLRGIETLSPDTKATPPGTTLVDYVDEGGARPTGGLPAAGRRPPDRRARTSRGCYCTRATGPMHHPNRLRRLRCCGPCSPGTLRRALARPRPVTPDAEHRSRQACASAGSAAGTSPGPTVCPAASPHGPSRFGMSARRRARRTALLIA